MLGIRKFNSIAIDLWAGPWQSFYCDGCLELIRGQEESQFKNYFKHNLSGKRHIAIVPPLNLATPLTPADATTQIKRVQQTLKTSDPLSLKRITIILETPQQYHLFQSALFEIFPE